MADTDQAAVTVELELADSSLGPDGSYQSVIQVRISSTKRQACDSTGERIIDGTRRTIQHQRLPREAVITVTPAGHVALGK